MAGWWFGTFFPYIGNAIIPTNFHIFSEGLKPPTRNQCEQLWLGCWDDEIDS